VLTRHSLRVERQVPGEMSSDGESHESLSEGEEVEPCQWEDWNAEHDEDDEQMVRACPGRDHQPACITAKVQEEGSRSGYRV
jgi:hypothetical protein